VHLSLLASLKKTSLKTASGKASHMLNNVPDVALQLSTAL